MPLGDFDDLALSLLETAVPFCAAIWLAAVLERGTLRLLRAHSYRLTPDALRLFASPSPQLARALAVAAGNAGRAYLLHVPDLCRDEGQSRALALADGSRLEMQLLIADSGGPPESASWLSLYKARGQAQFDERDMRAAALITPHLSQAFALNRAVHLEDSTSPRRVPGGERAVMRADGALLHCGARLAEMIRADYPAWDGVTLPEKLVNEVRRGGVVHFPGCGACVHVSQLGNTLLLTLREITLAGRLSPRELTVAQLFGSGASYKEIARRVALAPATVRNVVQNAYRKLGINNKAQLARLMIGSD